MSLSVVRAFRSVHQYPALVDKHGFLTCRSDISASSTIFICCLAALLAFDPFSRGLRLGAIVYSALA